MLGIVWNLGKQNVMKNKYLHENWIYESAYVFQLFGLNFVYQPKGSC